MTRLPRAERFARMVADPVRFARGVLGHDLWDTQAAILRSVAENRQTAVKACHSSSKTFTAAEATLWWLTRYEDGKVITTAPMWRQVEKLLWGEIHKALLTGRRLVRYPEPNLTELKFGPERVALGVSTDKRKQACSSRASTPGTSSWSSTRRRVWDPAPPTRRARRAGPRPT